MSFVLLDVGGTFIKAARFAKGARGGGGEIENVVRLRIPSFIPAEDGARCLDPSALAEVVFEAILRVSGGDTNPTEGILISGQMAGLAFVDEKGVAQAPLISWQDERYRNVTGVSESLGAQVLGSLGEGLRVGLPLVTLAECEIPSDAYVTSLLGFVTGLLIGKRSELVHLTDAASWGFVDVNAGDWHPAALEVLGLTRPQLPLVSQAVAPLGSCDLLTGAPVFTAVGDQQAALLGIGLSADEVSINLATGCQVAVITDRPNLDRSVQARPYFANQFLTTRTHLPAGRLLETAIAQAYGPDMEKGWDQLSLNDQNGTISPLVEDAVEKIVAGLETALAAVTEESNLPIAWSGGLAQRFPWIRNELSRRTGRPARVYEGDDAALAGLAALTTSLADG